MAILGLAHTHSNRQQKSRPKAAILCNGASDRARTGDPRFTRAVLYQLSYAGGHVVTQLRRQQLTMIRDIANRRKCSDGFSHFNALILETRCLALTGLKQNGAAMAQPKILLTCIDDRFIYGQDVELWNEAVGSNLVPIVNDEIAADSRKWAPMRVAAPEGVWTRFFSVQRTIDIIHTATPRQWILIMVASPADALALVKGGVPITRISIGHMEAGEGKRSATPAVAKDDADVAVLRELQTLGVKMEVRNLPSDEPDSMNALLY